jgi:hypothetical protein
MAFARNGNSLLFGRKEPVFKFVKIGDEVTGDVIEVTEKQRRHFVKDKAGNPLQGDPMWWMIGETGASPTPMPKDKAEMLDLKPVQDAVVRLQTRLRTEKGDNGIRRLILENFEMKEAVVNSVEDTDAVELETGGRLTVRYAKNFADDTRPAEKGNRKMFSAVYVPVELNDDPIMTKTKTPVPAGQDADAGDIADGTADDPWR